MRWSVYRIGGLSLGATLALAGCADTPPPPPAATTVAAAPAAPPPSGGIVLAPQPGGAPALVNDPSAPVDTPLCGLQAREAAAVGQSLLSQQYAQAGVCSGFACYDQSTATYIGADGYRHVCR